MDLTRLAQRVFAAVPNRWHYPLRLVWHATQRWVDGSGPQLGASIAFYTMFALAPWLVLTIALAGFVFGAEAARGQIFGQIEGLVGAEAARAVEAMIAAAWRQPGGLGAALLGVATLLLGASGVFAELRRAINAIAGIPPSLGSAMSAFVRVRLRAFALLLGFGFLAVASLLLSAVVAAFGKFAQSRWPALAFLASLSDLLVSGGLLAVAFGGLLRWLPDRPPGRRGLVISAVVSAALFTFGKYLIGFYLGRATFASSYGAAGSFVVLMLWVYYSSQIMLFGAACGYADEALRSPNAAPAAAAGIPPAASGPMVMPPRKKPRRRSGATAASTHEQASLPRLPHEHDESADSQQPAQGPPDDVGRRAFEDLQAGRVDTDRGPVMDNVYRRTVRNTPAPKRKPHKSQR